MENMTAPYSDEAIRRRLRLGEDSRWEFKEVAFRGDRPVSRQRESWADEIAAFANAKGGVLLLGVADAGEVSGMSRARLDAVERLVGEVCRDSVKPAVRPQMHRLELDERPFLLVEIPQGYAQHDSPGGSYIRVGGSPLQPPCGL